VQSTQLGFNTVINKTVIQRRTFPAHATQDA